MVDEAPVIIMLALLALISLCCVVVYGVCVCFGLRRQTGCVRRHPNFQCNAMSMSHFIFSERHNHSAEGGWEEEEGEMLMAPMPATAVKNCKV